MSITNLPEDLNLKNSSSIQLFDYYNPSDKENLQINLTKNTISFLQEGSKQVIHNNKTVSIKNSDFLILKSGHCLMTEKLPSPHKNYKSILLFFSDEDFINFKTKFKYLSNNQQPKTSILTLKYDAFINNLVESLKEILQMNTTIQQRLLKVKFEELMLYISETKGFDFLDALDFEINKHVISFKSIIESNKLNKLTLKQLAFLCNMSVSTFKRTFQKQYQESPIKWFQNQRLEYAAYLLHTKKKKSSEIYDLIGFDNHSNFIKAFKNKFGVTPKKSF